MRQGRRNRILEIAVEQLLDQVTQDFRVGLGTELVSQLLELGSKDDVILDDAVVNEGDPFRAVRVRVGVDRGRCPVRGPSRVADAV